MPTATAALTRRSSSPGGARTAIALRGGDRRGVELAERGPEAGPAAVVKAVHRGLRAAEPEGDLPRGEAGDVAQDQDLPLVLGEPLERRPQRLRALEADLLVALVARAHLREGDLAPAAQVVERGVAGDAQDPGGERALAPLVAGDRGDQLGEHVLGDVLGLVAVADNALDIALDAVGGAGARGGMAGASGWFGVAAAPGHGG